MVVRLGDKMLRVLRAVLVLPFLAVWIAITFLGHFLVAMSTKTYGWMQMWIHWEKPIGLGAKIFDETVQQYDI